MDKPIINRLTEFNDAYFKMFAEKYEDKIDEIFLSCFTQENYSPNVDSDEYIYMNFEDVLPQMKLRKKC